MGRRIANNANILLRVPLTAQNVGLLDDTDTCHLVLSIFYLFTICKCDILGHVEWSARQVINALYKIASRLQFLWSKCGFAKLQPECNNCNTAVVRVYRAFR